MVTLREMVARRAGGRCEYCQATEAVCSHCFHLEHIIPRTAGGKSDPVNYALACGSCNLAKGTKARGIDPQTGDEVALFNPRAQRWTEHFQWSPGCLEIVGKTALGRATVTALKLNEGRGRREARKLWFENGYLP